MKNKHCFLVFLLCSFFVLEANGQNGLLKRAEEKIAKEHYDSAVYLYEALVGQEPQNNAYKQKLLDLYYYTGRSSKAVALCSDLIKSPNYAGNLNFYFAFVEIYILDGQYAKARNLLLSIKDASWVMEDPSSRASIEAYIERIEFAEKYKDQSPAFIVKNEKLVNSKYADFSPQIIGNKVYFESKRIVRDPSGIPGYSDINSGFLYYANRRGNSALEASKTVFAVSSQDFMQNAGLAPFAYNSKAKKFAYSQNNFPAGVRHPYNPTKESSSRMGFYNNTSIEGLTQAMFKDFPYHASTCAFPAFSSDGKTLYFASTHKFRGVNYGGYDIFVTYLINGSWSEPQNLGAQVNTVGDDISPFTDNKGFLYFASNAHLGFGGFDIFRASKTNEGWGLVRNLGPSVNSSKDDLYFIYEPSSMMGYFASNRKESSGDYDIYSARYSGVIEMMPLVKQGKNNFAENDNNNNYIKDENALINETPTPTPAEQENTNVVNNNSSGNSLYDPSKLEQDKSRYNTKTTNTDPYDNKIPCADNAYIGVVADKVTKRPIEGVWIYVQNMKNGVNFKKRSSKYGEYAVILEPQTQYEILCSREGYENIRETFFTGDGQQQTLLGTIELTPSATNLQNDDWAENYNRTPPKQVLTPNNAKEDFIRASTLNKQLPPEGYVIQIGIFKNLNDKLRTKLSSYANIFAEKHKRLNANVYRLGIFANKAHANKVLKKIRTIKDFKEAFIKKQTLSNRTSADRMSNKTMVIFPKEEIAEAYSNPDKNTEDWADNPTLPAPDNQNNGLLPIKEDPQSNWADNPELPAATQARGVRPLEYKIQIGVYRKPSTASFPELSHVGRLESQLNPTNGLTYFYVAGYTTLEDARKARTKTEAAGVKQTMIVAFKNGKKVPLKNAVN